MKRTDDNSLPETGGLRRQAFGVEDSFELGQGGEDPEDGARCRLWTVIFPEA